MTEKKKYNLKTDDGIKEMIELALHTVGPVKATKFIVDFIEVFQLEGLEPPVEDYSRLMEECVKEGRIVELEYVLPDMNYRIKSMYFPKGTELRFVSKG